MSVSAFPTAVVTTAGVIYDLSSLGTAYEDTGFTAQTYHVQTVFRTAGDIDILRLIGSDSLNVQDPYTSKTDKCWVRCRYVSGNAIITGPTLNTWVACSTERVWEYSYAGGGGADTRVGTYDFTLASDSGGTNIKAGPKNVTFTAGTIA